MEAQKETLGFQAEVKQLLDLMIHSLYSNKEIFLRELISNASDAIDKLRFEAIGNPELYEDDHDLKIKVSFDKEARTVTISDNGIGMSREEVISNIGTIARSGTKEFFQALTGDQKKDAALIGQFGVGFYSSFIVADKVTLVTRRAGQPAEHAVRWESDGAGAYTLETVEKANRGTDVILHLRTDDEFLDNHRLRSIIRKYSDHITLPIVMPAEQFGEPKEDEPAEPQEETVNKASALWTRSRSEVTDEEYNEFYKNLTYDYAEPLARVHSRMEGKYEYTLLLYVPSQAPYDLWSRDHRHGIKLYVKRVFIMDEAEKLLPNYLRFVRGVIDSNDLPLNVSREILQNSKVVDAIRSNSVKKVLGLLEDLAEKDKEKYATFWQAFGAVIKEGVSEDPSNQETIARLLRFATTHTDEEVQNVSLEDYIGRMKEGQEDIYYITAETFSAAKNSPLLEIFRKRGIEVLLMHDVVDNWVVTHLTEYKGKKLQSVAKGELDLDKIKTEDSAETSSEETKPDASALKDLSERIKTALGGKVKDVRTTNRLVSAPACLVMDEKGLDANFLRLLKAAGQKVPDFKPIFEINPQHALINRLQAEANETRFAEWVSILFDQAVLSDGGQLEDPAGFVNRLNSLLVDLSK